MLYPVVRALNLDPRFAANTIAFPDSPLYLTPASQSFAPIPSNSVPYNPDWVNFDERNWQSIVYFMRRHGLKYIINVQNEGPFYDKGYYRFRSVRAADYSFWDLDFAKIYRSNEKVHILDSVRTMLLGNGILWWYPPRQRQHCTSPRGLTCYVGGSEANKRWHSAQWARLILRLSEVIGEETVSVISGNSLEERAELDAIRQEIRQTPSVIFPGSGTLDENIDHIARSKLLLTHDSYPIHLASLLFIPTVGLYFATDPIIWGSHHNQFRYVASTVECSGRKQGTGNCVHFHTACPNIDEIKAAIAVEDVFPLCTSMLNAISLST
jgi:hypothetical protein